MWARYAPSRPGEAHRSRASLERMGSAVSYMGDVGLDERLRSGLTIITRLREAGTAIARSAIASTDRHKAAADLAQRAGVAATLRALRGLLVFGWLLAPRRFGSVRALGPAWQPHGPRITTPIVMGLICLAILTPANLVRWVTGRKFTRAR